MRYAQAKLDLLRRLPPAKLRAKLPAWAKRAGEFPAPFVPDLRMVLPRGPVTVMTNEGHRAWVFERFLCQPVEKMSAAEYVAAFDRASGLAAHPVEWVRPIDGNYT